MACLQSCSKWPLQHDGVPRESLHCDPGWDISSAAEHWLDHCSSQKGDKADLNNYRPITVIPVLAKLFASVLTRRLADWAERNNLRAPTHAGFRATRGTSNQLSVLNYIVKRCLSRGEKLYCCFVDVEKAFDTVDRDVLWAVLANIAVRGHFLKCLQSLYGVGSAAVRTAQGTSGAFRCFQGVQQGSPLSPLLFGLLLDCLHKVLKAVPGSCASALPLTS